MKNKKEKIFVYCFEIDEPYFFEEEDGKHKNCRYDKTIEELNEAKIELGKFIIDYFSQRSKK